MAITYQAGRRIQGLAYVTQTATLTNAEDSGSWTGSGSLSITSGELQVRLGGSNAGVAQRDITSVDSSSWVMRWKWEQTGTQTNASPNDMRCMIGLASNAGSFGGNSPTYGSTSGDHIGMYMDVGHIHFVAFNGTTPSAQSTSSSMINFTGAPFTKYCEIIRDGSSFTLNIFDSSTFTGTKLTRSLTYSGMTSLRYIGGQAGWYGGGGGIQANMSEITFYDGITSAMPTGDAKPTNVQVGSRFEETDTRKMYHFEDGSPTYETTYPISTGWTQVNTASSYWAIASTTQQFQNRIANNGSGANYDLGLLDSYDEWLLRFELTVDSSLEVQYNGDAVTVFGIQGRTDNTSSVGGSYGTARAQVQMQIATANSTRRIQAKAANDTTVGQSGAVLNFEYTNDTKYYIEVKKTGATSYTIGVGTNSDYTTGRTEGNITATLTGLRYLHFESWGQNASYESRNGGIIENLKFYAGTSTGVMPSVWSQEGT